MKVLRDPIWQAIGTLIAVLALFFTTSTPSPSNGELSIIKTQSISFSDYLLPSRLLNLSLPKTTQSMDSAVVDYYAIINRGGKPILPNEYTSPLTVRPRTDDSVFLVDSCAQPSESLPGKTPNSCQSGNFVSSIWKQHDKDWIHEPALLNPGEQFCVIVIRKSSDEPTNVFVNWVGRIVGVNLVTYKSVADYSKHIERSFTDYLQTYIRLEGFGAYWFAILQLTAFYATLVLARQTKWLRSQQKLPIWPLAIAMLLSTSTAEILVDMFINQNFTNLSPLVWPLLLAHFLLIAYLATYAIRNRLSSQ